MVCLRSLHSLRLRKEQAVFLLEYEEQTLSMCRHNESHSFIATHGS